MAVKFFTVPIFRTSSVSDELDRFLTTHEIDSIDQQVVQSGRDSAWTFCMHYQNNTATKTATNRVGKIDYREVLEENQFAVYARLRDLRKQLAAQEGVPPYAVFKNEQLAAMVRGCVTTLAAMSEIPGVGTGRVEKYGDAFLNIMRESVSSLQSVAKPRSNDAKK